MQTSAESANQNRPAEVQNILEKIVAFLKRFILFENPAHYTLLGLWIIQTHSMDCFDFTGYVFVYSAEKQSGKTRVLEVLDLLVANSSGVQVSPTEAVLFRTAQGHTQLLDEVDSWMNMENLRSVLNQGFKRSGKVIRMKRKEAGGYDEEEYSPFAARALAGIGKHILPDITKDRCYAIRIQRQKSEERREKLTRKKQAEAEELRVEIENWAKENKDKIQAVYDDEDCFPYLDSFADRTIDISQPLASIVEVLFKNNPALPGVRGELVEAISSTRAENEEVSRQNRILLKLAELSIAEDPLIGNATELAERCTAAGQPATTNDISDLLQKHGIKTKSIRIHGDDPKKRYSLPSSQLVDLATRYVPQGLVTTKIQVPTTVET